MFKSTDKLGVNRGNRFAGVLLVLTLFAVLAVAESSQAEMISSSWIVRSEAQANQSIFGGGVSNLNFADRYNFESWPFRGGFDWEVDFDMGTLSGNVEGALEATYANRLAAPGVTTVGLGYSGINDESRINSNIKANVSIKPYIGANIFGLWADASLPMSVVNIDLSTRADFTTGLGTAHAKESQQHTLLELGGELLLISYGIDIHAVSSIEFKPRMFSGELRYEHAESGTERSKTVEFWQDGPLDFDLNLDKPGRWNVSLIDFCIAESSFRTEFGFGVGFELGVPLIGASAKINADISIVDTGFFTPRFDSHYLNDDTVGEFCIFVAPEPSSLGLLGVSLVCVIRRRHRK